MTTASSIAANTIDAYSYARYGADQWELAAGCFLDLGYTAPAVTEILMSKHMRWAGDSAEMSNTPDEPTAADAIAHVRKYKTQINTMLADCGHPILR